MDIYTQTLPPYSSWSAAADDDPGGNCTSAKCVPPESVAFTILSSVASIIGSLLIIGTFLRWKDLRTIARMILVFLAISDLLAGIGYVFGAAVYIQYYYIDGYCHSLNGTNPVNITQYSHLCTAQSFLTTLMPMSSFLWTGNLAIYLFFSILWPKMKFTRTLMILFHVTAWGIPLVTCVAIVSKGYFGASESRTSGGWCWIKYNQYSKTDYYVAELMAGKIWELSVCILALFVCVAIKVVVAKRFKKTKVVTTKVTTQTEYSSISMEKQIQAAYSKLDQKLMWIPIAFLLLRVWGNARFIISLSCGEHGTQNAACCKVLYNPFLVGMQSICDPGQGWSNALLFVIFNQKILHRLCPWLQPCWDSFRSRLRGCVQRVCPAKKRKRAVKNVNTVAVDRKSGEEDTSQATDREPLLNTSLQSSSNLDTSVLYSVTPGQSTSWEEGKPQTPTKPRTPSINSKC